MSNYIRRYQLETWTPSTERSSVTRANLVVPAGSCFITARQVSRENILVWLAVDEKEPATTAQFFLLKDGEKISDELAEQVLHLKSVFYEGIPTHLFLYLDNETGPWDFISALATKCVTPVPDSSQEKSDDES